LLRGAPARPLLSLLARQREERVLCARSRSRRFLPTSFSEKKSEVRNVLASAKSKVLCPRWQRELFSFFFSTAERKPLLRVQSRPAFLFALVSLSPSGHRLGGRTSTTSEKGFEFPSVVKAAFLPCHSDPLPHAPFFCSFLREGDISSLPVKSEKAPLLLPSKFMNTDCNLSPLFFSWRTVCLIEEPLFIHRQVRLFFSLPSVRSAFSLFHRTVESPRSKKAPTAKSLLPPSP